MGQRKALALASPGSRTYAYHVQNSMVEGKGNLMKHLLSDTVHKEKRVNARDGIISAPKREGGKGGRKCKIFTNCIVAVERADIVQQRQKLHCMDINDRTAEAECLLFSSFPPS